jgi:hypothetical protein
LISAYPIGSKVWLVHTPKVADPDVPRTLPIGSIVLTVEQAKDVRHQLIAAIQDAQGRAE